MKKLVLLLLLFCTLGAIAQPTGAVISPSTDGIGLPKPIITSGTIPLDGKSLYWDFSNGLWRPYTSTAEVLLRLPPEQRIIGQLVVINTGGVLDKGIITGGVNYLYWFRSNITSLEAINSAGGGGGVPVGLDDVLGVANTSTRNMATTGNVGIGTTTPAYKLDVQEGDLNVRNGVLRTTWNPSGSRGGITSSLEGQGAAGIFTHAELYINGYRMQYGVQNQQTGAGTSWFVDPYQLYAAGNTTYSSTTGAAWLTKSDTNRHIWTFTKFGKNTHLSMDDKGLYFFDQDNRTAGIRTSNLDSSKLGDSSLIYKRYLNQRLAALASTGGPTYTGIGGVVLENGSFRLGSGTLQNNLHLNGNNKQFSLLNVDGFLWQNQGSSVYNFSLAQPFFNIAHDSVINLSSRKINLNAPITYVNGFLNVLEDISAEEVEASRLSIRTVSPGSHLATINYLTDATYAVDIVKKKDRDTLATLAHLREISPGGVSPIKIKSTGHVTGTLAGDSTVLNITNWPGIINNWQDVTPDSMGVVTNGKLYRAINGLNSGSGSGSAQFAENSTTLSTTKNISIGTNAPFTNSKLHVEGDAYVGGDVTMGYNGFAKYMKSAGWVSNAIGSLAPFTVNDFGFFGGNTGNMNLVTNGQVQATLTKTGGFLGLGTQNPAFKLDVAGTANVAALRVPGGNVGDVLTMDSTGNYVPKTPVNDTISGEFDMQSGTGLRVTPTSILNYSNQGIFTGKQVREEIADTMLARYANLPILVVQSSTQQLIPQNVFTRIGLETISVDTDSGWNSVENWYTIPSSGTYHIEMKYRFIDNPTPDLSHGLGAGTLEGDSPSFLWSYVHGYSATIYRHGILNQKTEYYNQGDHIRMFAYVSNASQAIGSAEMVINKIR